MRIKRNPDGGDIYYVDVDDAIIWEYIVETEQWTHLCSKATNVKASKMWFSTSRNYVVRNGAKYRCHSCGEILLEHIRNQMLLFTLNS
jgi:hypothetical protein